MTSTVRQCVPGTCCTLKSLDNCAVLVQALQQRDVCELSKKFFQISAVSKDTSDLFDSLDHENTDGFLQLKYLLRLVSVELMEDKSAWTDFLDVLKDVGEPQVSDYLRTNVTHNTAIIQSICDKSENADIYLREEDVSILIELMSEVRWKWDLIGTILGLPHKIINKWSEERNLSIKLKHVLIHWLNQPSKPATLRKLKEALQSKTVGESRLAFDLEEKFCDAKGIKPDLATESSPFQIGKTSKIKVCDGRSTLLLVTASLRESVYYQWIKDDQVLVNNSTYSGVCEDLLVVQAHQGVEGKYTCCVCYEDKKLYSNEVTLTVCYPPGKKELLDFYRDQSVIPSGSWPHNFRNLNYFVNLNLRQATAEKYNEVSYKQVFKKYNSKDIILIKGCPGSGKSTLLQKITKDWVDGCILENAKLVFKVTPTIFSAEMKIKSVENIIQAFYQDQEYLDEDIQAIVTSIRKNQGKDVCFLIDGLDEYKPEVKSVICGLVCKRKLTNSMVVVSSRPATLRDLQTNATPKEFEIVEFSDDQIDVYIDSFFDNDISSKDRLINEFRLRPNIRYLCKLPLHLAMICCFCQNEGGNLPNTQTKIYKEFVRSTISRELRCQNDKIQLRSLRDLSGEAEKNFKELCRLAYQMSLKSEQTIVLNHEDFNITSCLGLVTIDSVPAKSGFDTSVTYKFLHVTFRDFFTAYYIANLKQEEQMNIIESWSVEKFSAVCCFYFGLINFKFECGIKLEYILRGEYDTLKLLRCAFESQQDLVCNEVMKRLNGVLDLNSYSLITSKKEQSGNEIWPSTYPGCSQFVHSDLAVVHYVMSTTSERVESIHLPSSRATVSFFKHSLDKNICSLCHLQNLIVHEALNSDGIICLSSTLKSCTNLNSANLHFNNINCKGAKHFISGLQSVTNLRSLSVFCSAHSQGIPVLLEGFHLYTNVDIRLSFEHLDMDDVVEVGRGISGLNGLWSLKLSECVVTPQVSRHLACGINLLSNLHILNLSRNNICSRSMRILASALRNLRNLHSLNLSHNNIDSHGTAKLFIALKYLDDLSHLNLSHNTIGASARDSIANSLRYFYRLESLCLSYNRLDAESAIILLRALKYCDTPLTVNISHNFFVEDTTDLEDAVRHPTHCRDLILDQEIKIKPAPKTSWNYSVLCCFLICVFVLFWLGPAASDSRRNYESKFYDRKFFRDL